MFDLLFDDIGAKIKKVAIAFFSIQVITAVIIGIGLLFAKQALVGFGIMFGGSVAAWLSSLSLYGFGDLIENTDVSNTNTFEIHKLLKEIKENQEKQSNN